MANNLFPTAGIDLTTPTGSELVAPLPPLPEPPGPLASGFKTGVAGVKSAAGGLVSMAGRGFGVKGLEEAGNKITADANEQAAIYARRAEDITSVGDAVDFGQYAIATALPSLLTMLAGGAAGRLVGGVAARKITEDATRRLIQQTGMAGGAVGTSIGLEAGGIYPEAVKEGVESPIARSIVGGVAAGALDVVPEFYLARKLGILGDAAKGTGSRLVNAATTAGKSALLEGATEGAQTGVERLAAGQPLNDADARSDYLNSILIGLISGGAFGGAAGAIAPVQKTPENEHILPDLSTNQQNIDTTSPVVPPTLEELQTQRQAVVAARDEIATKIAALEADLAAPAEERQGRTRGSITKELMQARKAFEAASSPLAALDAQITDLQVTALRQVERTPLTVGTEISLPQEQPVADGPIQPPVAPIELSDPQRQAFATQTAPFERTADKVATLQGVPLVELPEGSPQPAAEQPPLIVAPDPTFSSSRGTQKQGTPAQKQRAFVENSLQAVDLQTKDLVDSGAMPREKAEKIRGIISRELERVFDGTQDPSGVRDKIEGAIAKAVKGRINKGDAETFAQELLGRIAGQPREFLSKGGLDAYPRADAIERFSVGPSAVKPVVVAEGKTLYRETNVSGLDDLLMSDNQFEFQPVFVADNPDIAIGQGGNRGVHVEFRPNSLSGVENKKPGTGDLAGREYKIDVMAPRAVQAVTFPKKFNFKQLRGTTRLALSRFTKTELPDGRIRFTRKGLESRAPVGQTLDQLAAQGKEIYLTLQRLLGDPADVEVRLFEQNDPQGFAGRYRTGWIKDIIEIATNAKDALSVAYHEAFHRIETKHLTRQERAILARGLKKGTDLYNRVIDAARKYDAANGTNIASEIESVPQEARAYGFEMWRRGELEATGPVQKVFQKIQRLLERVKNYILGLGFTSVEDLYQAVEMGAYAKTAANPLMAIDATQAYNFVDESLESRAALDTSLQDVITQAKQGSAEPTQIVSMFANVVDGLNVPRATFRELFGAHMESFKGGTLRAYMTHFMSGLALARYSVGFKNVFGVVTAYEQRKNRLIAEGVDVKLKTWQNRKTSNANIANVSRALLARTVDGIKKDTAEYQSLLAPLTEYERTMFKEATDMIASQLDAEFVEDRRTMQNALGADSDAYAEWLENRTLQVQRLKDEGYIPERRYGDHVVYATVPYTSSKGETVELTVLREQFESQAEANLRLKQYQEVLGPAAPDMKIQYGFKYSPEHDASLSYQQFLDMARRFGIEVSQAEKERLAKAMISADSVRRNRIFRRKNVAGYSEDGLRVLSEFAVTMANKIAHSEFSGAIADAQQGKAVTVGANGALTIDEKANLWAQDGPNAGFLRQRTDDMVDFVLQPQRGGKWAQTARMAASLHFLGGSVAAAVVQASALPMVSAPYLSQFTGYGDANGKILSAFRLALGNSALRDIEKLQNRSVQIPEVDRVTGLRDALARAAEDGTTLDTEIYQIMGQSRGSMLSKSRNARRALEAWMYPFREAEKVNRTATFVAAYRIGQQNKLQGDKLYEFARDAVHNTQNRFDEANRPALARNPIGALLFTFKATPIFLVETILMLHKQNPRAAVFMLLALFIASGVKGLPFAEDLMDVVDTVAQRIFKSPFNSERALKNVLKNASEAIVGADMSGLFLNGVVNELTGLSFASRVSLGNLIPGTRMFAADTDYKRNLQEMLGPVASQVVGGFEAVESLSKGDWVKAIRQGAPLAAQNAVKAAEQWSGGYAQDAGGRKLVDVSGFGALMQALGFSSAAVSNAYQLDRIDKQTEAFYQMVRTDFTNDIVKAVRSGDSERVRETVELVGEWNKAHPDMPIALNPSSIRRTIAEAGMPLNQRTLLSLPKQLRASSEAYELTRNE